MYKFCLIEESGKQCGGKDIGRGMCMKHYHRWRKSGGSTAPSIFAKRKIAIKEAREGSYSANNACKHEGCEKPYYAKGVCNMHYQRKLLGKVGRKPTYPRECTFEGCDRQTHCRGLCAAHHKRKLHGRDMHAPIKGREKNRKCTIDGCDRKHCAKGYCSTHYKRNMQGTRMDMPISSSIYSREGVNIMTGSQHTRPDDAIVFQLKRTNDLLDKQNLILEQLAGGQQGCTEQQELWTSDGEECSNPEDPLSEATPTAESKQKLTKRQEDMYQFMVKSTSPQLTAPSIRDISGHFGMTETGAQNTITILRRKGYLEKRSPTGGSFFPVNFPQK